MSTSAPAAARARFGYRAFSAGSFDELLDQHVEHPTQMSASKCIDSALRCGRLLLQAAAGAGKTEFLARVLSEVEQGHPRVSRGAIVRLRDLAALPESSSPEEVAAHLRTLAGLEDLDSSQQRTLLALDGLNEAPNLLTGNILEAIERLAAQSPWLSVVVSDRLTRRELPSRRWSLCGLTGTTDDDIVGRLGALPAKDLSLLRSPFFLDRVSADDPEVGRASWFAAQLETVLPDSRKAEALARAAYQAYETHKAPIITAAEVRDAVGDDALLDLLAAKVLQENGSVLRFEHQLWHDYLAARSLAGQPSTWERSHFVMLTLGTSSPDALGLLLGQVSPDLVDTLLRNVYDWNLYNAAHLLASSAEAAPATSAAMLALLAERRFDPIYPTTVQATDALRLMPGPLAASYLSAGSVDSVLSIAEAQLPGDAAYQAWASLFTSNDAPWLLQRLEEPDGLDGWTAANVLRRCITPDLVPQVAKLAGTAMPVIGWRAVHVLGALPGTTLDELWAIVANAGAEEHLRYGALRSFVEQAVHTPDPDVRTEALLRLAGLAVEIAAVPRLGYEIARVLQLTNPPRHWVQDVTPVVENLVLAAPNETERQRWVDVGAAILSRQP
jgi:hypothetical protein